MLAPPASCPSPPEQTGGAIVLRTPENDTLADVRPVAFDVIYRIGDELISHWNAIDAGLLERARGNRERVMAERSQRSGWRHPSDPGYVLKEPSSYKTILSFPQLTNRDARRLKGALRSIGDQRDMWAHQTPALTDHPGPAGHLLALTQDAHLVAELLAFSDLVEPLDQLRAMLEDGRVAPPLRSTASEIEPPASFRIGAPTEVPLGSRIAKVTGGRVWGEDARPLVLPNDETRTDEELARLWSRIIGKRDASIWVALDGRVIVEHGGRHWVIDVIGPNRAVSSPGDPLIGWVIDRCRPLLDTDGSVWDYASGRMYFEADTPPGRRLLATLPDGGPIQVTAGGDVGARIDDSGESLYIGTLEDAELEIFLA